MKPDIDKIKSFGAKHFGLKFKEVKTYQSVTFDNLNVHYEDGIIYYKPDSYSINENIVHEFGHYLAATKSQRKKPNWGLRLNTNLKKEIQACRYELGLMKILGFDYRSIEDRAHDLNCPELIKTLSQIVGGLRRRGL